MVTEVGEETTIMIIKTIETHLEEKEEVSEEKEVDSEEKEVGLEEKEVGLEEKEEGLKVIKEVTIETVKIITSLSLNTKKIKR